MYIHEAVTLALEKNKHITRDGFVKIKPTNSILCCVLKVIKDPTQSAPRWNPKANDLISNDWTLCD